ncbi:MAG: hypothetical protein R3301_08395 [Saprospiraceae bacterium]|nr:hypothetical protein [Saprospiraceae bacterium]
MTTVATILVNLAGAYLLIGVVFAVWFVVRGVTNVDPGVRGSSVVFRLLLLPGSVLLWPVLLGKWRKAKK